MQPDVSPSSFSTNIQTYKVKQLLYVHTTEKCYYYMHHGGWLVI